MDKYCEGKVKRILSKNSEIDLKRDTSNQLHEELNLWQRTFCIMGQRVLIVSKLKPIGVGIAKANLKTSVS